MLLYYDVYEVIMDEFDRALMDLDHSLKGIPLKSPKQKTGIEKDPGCPYVPSCTDHSLAIKPE